MDAVKKITAAVGSFFDVRHSIKAKIFVSFTISIISIAALISGYWHNFTVDSATGTLIDNVDKSMNGSMLQLENAVQDIKRMHSTLLYEANNINYILKDYGAPGSDWFKAYNQTYSSLRIMEINLSRTIAGTGIFKSNGETCMNGILCLDQQNVFRMDEVKKLKTVRGDDLLFDIDKKKGETKNEVLKYVFIGRSVMNNGQERAVIISRLNETILKGILSQTLYSEGYVLLLDGAGHIIYDSSPGADQEDKENAVRASGRTQKAEISGNYMVFSQKSQYAPLTLISGVPQKYLDEINMAALAQLLVMLFVAVIVTAVISMTISNKITLGLRKLSAGMKKVGGGSAVEIGTISSADEVGDLYVSFRNMTSEIQKLLDDVRENEKQKRIMEIKVLRAQISPHFLYNSLNTINYLAMLQNSDNIHVLSSSLIDLLQAAVNIDDQLIGLEDEIKYVGSYINIQQYRFPYRIHMDYQVEPQVRRCRVPKMILQPIVENAIIHGLSEDGTGGIIRIRAYSMDGRDLIFHVTDNGIGMSTEKIEQVMKGKGNLSNMRFSGIGIGNVDARIKLQFGDDYGITIYSKEKVFTTVEIKLPLIRGDEENHG